ncbi:hypothetical protein C6503_03560 [Candidatus Poribacteria bacterium]|nr:MAG: hypothetical protein C6503_03560 [Candidatus Poribacteria bacterium]
MTTNALRDIIARCHQRHEQPFKQRKSIVEPLLYKGLPYHFTVYCAHRYPVMLQDLEAADISFMPIGRFPGNDRPPRSFGEERFLKRQQATDWETRRWHKSWGIHVYTGTPSERDGAPWHDIDFKYEAICAAPDAVFACVQALVDAVANPLLVMSKSGGLRFSCRIPGYLHPNTQQARLYVHKHAPTSEKPHQHDTYLEILGEKGYGCWDGRYEILLGDLLDPPVISKEVLFPPIDALRTALHKPIPQNIQHEEHLPDAPYSLGSGKLDLAKEAFFKRGFSYVRQEDRFHYWHRQGDEGGNTEVSLWQSEGNVWICASTPETELPIEATLLTDVWKDTGILPPIPETGLPLDDKVLAIREGTLSPLALKRPTPVLHASKPTEDNDATGEEISVQMQRALERRARVLGFIPRVDSEKDGEVGSILRNNGAICLNVIDAALAETDTLQTTEAQILQDHRLFLDPEYAEIAEQILERRDGTQQLCITNVTREDQLFLECELSKTTLEAWVANYQGSALGNFATALLNATEIRDKSHANSIKRLRTVVQTFEWLEEEIIQQMCHVDAETVSENRASDRLRKPSDGNGLVHRQRNEQDPRFSAETIQEFPTVSSDPNWTFWHQLKRFFAHYIRDDDAPMRWENKVLRFYVPPVLHPSIKHLLVTSLALYDEHLHRVFLEEETEILPAQPMAWVPGNRVFQIRTGTYPRKTILDLDNTWDVFGMSETGQQIFWRIQAEIERDPNVKHAIITHIHTVRQLGNIGKNENVCFLTGFRFLEREGLETAFQEAEVIWIVGMPEMGPRAIVERAQILFGNDEEPLSYEMERESQRYKDERVQSIYEKDIIHIFRDVIERAQRNRLENKKVMLITGLRIPEITDRPETLLFDWEDLEVAGGLDKLSEAIATRQRFERERDTLTDQSSRKEVEAVLGCSARQASRVLQRLRGRKIVRPPLREQILALLSSDGEKTTPELTAAIQGHPKAINTKLTRLVNAGEIVKVRRGVYRLPEP